MNKGERVVDRMVGSFILPVCFKRASRSWKKTTASMFPIMPSVQGRKTTGISAFLSCRGRAVITSTETSIFQMLGKAGTKEFKELLPGFK